MEWNNAIIPTNACTEKASLISLENNNSKITVEQQLSIQQPKPEDYYAISKWDLKRICKCCENLKKQSILISDIILTIGSLALGAFFSAFLGGVNISNTFWKIVFYVLSSVIGSCSLVVAFFLKKDEHNDAKKSAEDIEEILNHISLEDKEGQK